MMFVTSTTDPASGRERRQELRASFAPHRRPQLQLKDGTFPVLDVSSRGLRIRHFDAARPVFGEEIEGTLRFHDDRPPVTVRGLIIRVQTADVVIRCEEGTLPVSWILEEVARADQASDASRRP